MSDTTHISETISAGQLRAFIERIERIEEEIKTANSDKSEVYKEARGCGFDVKAIRQCVAARKLDSAEREERTAIFELYWSALTDSVHVHTPAREIIEKFDAETGEITEHEQPETATKSTTKEGESDAKSAQVPAEHCDLINRRRQDAERAGSQPPIPHQNALAESAADAISAPIPNPQPPPLFGADKPEAVSPPAVSGAHPKPLNPDCRKASLGEQCALMHSQALCSKCQQEKDARRIAA